jgi:hypothetical protein
MREVSRMNTGTVGINAAVPVLLRHNGFGLLQ